MSNHEFQSTLSFETDQLHPSVGEPQLAEAAHDAIVVEVAAGILTDVAACLLTESEPEAAVVEQPEAVVAEQPEAVVAEQPEAVVVEQPEAVVVEQPEPVVVEQPAAAVIEQPAAAVAEQPEAVVAEQPEAVVAEQPAAAVIEQPAAAVVGQPQPAVTEHPPAVVNEQPQATGEVKSKKKRKQESVGETFSDLELSGPVLEAVQRAGYEIPTEIQAQIIPHILAGRDVLAQSQTGTGKTAAFALPILSRINVRQRTPQVLVLAPTRELAIQVANSFSTYAAGLPGLDVAAIYGGQDYEAQFRQLRRGVQVVVGTPGRVIDHIKRGTLDLSGIVSLVLDEADEMLNMGFLEDVQFVLEQTPEQRQIALFSATLPPAIRDIAENYLSDPAQITIKNKTMTAASIRQRALFVAPREKVEVLKRILEAEQSDGVIVFTKTKDATVSVAEQLSSHGLSAVALNGDMPQRTRERTIENLKAGRLDILVATDVAARGLDVSRISHVFNYDLPHDSESYIHRVGRTGRAGRKGEAIIFLTNAQRGKLRLIEKATKQPIEVVQPPTADDINAMRVERFKQQITETTAAKDLTLFTKMISEYAAESGKPVEIIAAALAEIAQGGRPFFIKDLPKRSKPERSSHDFDDRGHRDNGRHEHGRSEARADVRRMGPPAAGKLRYRIEVGRRDGVKPGNIVGAVANEAGIDGSFIGPIRIHDSFSIIDLPEGMPSDIYQTLRRTWIVGKQMRLSLDNGSAGDGGPTPSFRQSKPRPGKGPAKGNRKPHAKGFHSGKGKKRKTGV